jgi:2-polyprenyl-3-methyl-5-hydroxy-6-metoxy-1,4-benzoquinol methylase
MMNELLNQAGALFEAGRFEEAAEIYLKLEANPEHRAVCLYNLARISNVTGDPSTAHDLYYAALYDNKHLVSLISPPNHKNHNYVFNGKHTEREYNNCPLCGKQSLPHWCYFLPSSATYIPDFNPVRVWLKCGDCNHLFAQSFPEDVTDSYDMQTQERFFPYYEKLLKSLKSLSKGKELLEIGIGGCECALVARNMGFNVFGIDINEKLVEYAGEKHGLNAEVHDFIKFEPGKKWDIIIMGDVLEHVSDPVAAVRKVSELLADKGVFWISTPDFESEYTIKAGHVDPMRRESWHMNYFSYKSLAALLRRFGLEVKSKDISAHYNGSMEITAVKN